MDQKKITTEPSPSSAPSPLDNEDNVIQQQQQDEDEDDVGVEEDPYYYDSKNRRQTMLMDGELFGQVQMQLDHENPNLFSETYAMCFASAAIFPLADVREAARTGHIDAPEVISLPVRVSVIVAAFFRNMETLKRVMKPAAYEFVLPMKPLLDGGESIYGTLMSTLLPATVHYFGDDYSKSECVYALVKNPILKRIVLCFRGSITTQDWFQDSKNVVAYVRNPLGLRPGLTEKVGIHLGFKEYLYDESRRVASSLVSLEPVMEKLDVVKLAVQRNARDLLAWKYSTSATDRHDDGLADAAENVSSEEGGPSGIGPSEGSSEGATENAVATSNIGDDPANSSRSSRTKVSRLTRILEEMDSLWKENDDCRIYITGHSLG
jgi:hypothetical protein